MANLHEVRLKRKYVRIRQGECVRVPFPADLPIRTGPPAIAVDEEGEVAIVKKKFSIQSLNMNRFDIFSSSNEVK